MLSYIAHRAFWILPVIVLVAASTFFLMYQAPGGPWDREKPMPPQAVANLNARFGLDKPQWVNVDKFEAMREAGEKNPFTLAGGFLDSQFFNYLGNVFQGDLGPTYASRGSESVQDVIRDQFPVSMRLGMVAIVFAICVGVPLGVLGALRQNTFVDYISLLTSTLG